MLRKTDILTFEEIKECLTTLFELESNKTSVHATGNTYWLRALRSKTNLFQQSVRCRIRINVLWAIVKDGVFYSATERCVTSHKLHWCLIPSSHQMQSQRARAQVPWVAIRCSQWSCWLIRRKKSGWYPFSKKHEWKQGLKDSEQWRLCDEKDRKVHHENTSQGS